MSEEGIQVLESDVDRIGFQASDVADIVSRAVNPVEYSSDQELFSLLCNSILIDGGGKIFALDESSGRRCFTISPREMLVSKGQSREHWEWGPVHDSRFAEVLTLKQVWGLEIAGVINSRMLSKKTYYATYIVFRIAENSWGLDFPLKALMKIGNFTNQRIVCLNPSRDGDEDSPESIDGWMKLNIGEFYCDDGEEGDLVFALQEIKLDEKSGLIFEGIELRPLVVSD